MFNVHILFLLGALLIAIPVVTLVSGLAFGFIPNPFEVCVEGGTNC